jgi:hypothetical protein
MIAARGNRLHVFTLMAIEGEEGKDLVKEYIYLVVEKVAIFLSGKAEDPDIIRMVANEVYSRYRFRITFSGLYHWAMLICSGQPPMDMKFFGFKGREVLQSLNTYCNFLTMERNKIDNLERKAPEKLGKTHWKIEKELSKIAPIKERRNVYEYDCPEHVKEQIEELIGQWEEKYDKFGHNIQRMAGSKWNYVQGKIMDFIKTKKSQPND